MTESNPLPLVTARLIVRVMRLDDAPTFAAYRNDADIARFQGWSTPFTLDDAERFITAQADLTWPVCGGWYQVALERDGIMIGDVGVNRSVDGRQATIGYSLAKPHHRFGYATEAVSAMVHLLFTEGVERVLATTDPGNGASAEVLRRAGFRHQGGDVNTEPGPGEGGDEDRYEITPAGRSATDTVTRVVAIDRALANDVGALVALETCLFDEDAGQHDRYADES